MKATHTLYLLLISLLCVTGFTACDKSDNGFDNGDDYVIWDFYPIELSIAVQDAQGNDLLNPETPGNIAKQGIKAIYNGKTYEKDAPISQTKMYLARFYGLQTMKSETGKHFLTFGEFNGAGTFNNEKVTIDWNDGTQDVITFSSKLTWESKNDPVINRKFCLNGEDTGLQFGDFVITKEPVITSSTASD